MKNEYRYYVKIQSGNKPLTKKEYFRDDMTFAFFKKWEWYFKYREALLRIEQPKRKVWYETGSYEHVPPADILEKRLKGNLQGAKASLTKYQNRIAKAKFEAKHNSGTLFPIDLEKHPNWEKVEKQLKWKKEKVERCEKDLAEFYAGKLLPYKKRSDNFYHKPKMEKDE